MKEEEVTTIQASFDETLKNTDLQGVAVDMSELAIDSFLKEGLFRDIPIVGAVLGVAKFGVNVHDRLFLKKILSFMNELKNVAPQKRKEMIDDLDASRKHRVKIGEKLLYIIDSCNDFENAELVANLFKAFIEGKISYDDFLITSNIIQKITQYDFRWFLKEAKDFMNAEDARGLIGSGLFDLKYEPVDVRIEDEDDYKKLMEGGNKYKTDIDGGGVDVTLSHAGNIIMDLFGKQEKKKVLKL